ncbi:MAG TPA: hypothetical protein VIL86_04630 [Tepidisphaeraceae bacterium]|jgi:hypothetical protein
MTPASPNLSPRDRLMRRQAALLTPEERMARMEALQNACFAALQANPAGWEHFLRRNFKKRAVRHDSFLPR